jgi:hypothetical protein
MCAGNTTFRSEKFNGRFYLRPGGRWEDNIGMALEKTEV